MAISFDLQPTERLSGIHMVGTVSRRFLISYAVPPAALEHFLPPGAELSLHDGMGWVSACFVHMGDMRPNFAPKFAGMGYNYLIHRTRARLPFPDGKLREAVLVLQPNINRRLLSTFGSLMTGVRFQCHPIEFTEDRENWRIVMRGPDSVLYDASIPKATFSPKLTGHSRFESAQAADEFLLGVSFGGEWKQGETELKLLPETHEPWTTMAASADTREHAFLRALGIESLESDHVISMTEIPHYFGVRPIRSKLMST